MKISKAIFLLVCLALIACQSKYDKAVKAGLRSENVKDSLVWGMHMGQSKKDFYDTCWKLNKEEKVFQGPGNKYAKFYIEPESNQDSLYKKEVLFYGMFDDKDKMYGMDMIYSYSTWAIWNENTQSTTLVEELKNRIRNDYGGTEFFPIDLNSSQKAWVKIDDNRQFLVYPKSEKDVAVKIEDLRHKRNDR